MRAIQFETVVNGGIIRIPEQYMKLVPATVSVTLVPSEQKRPKFRPKTKDKPMSIEEFPAVLNTRGWKFSREEANERR
ncbi:MAG: hypothetical protein LBB91_09045 [Clostridiales bacterium]|jgi:hypothetical protein|nr:hypothetical protein [Clostridiales bacterium]